MSSSKSDKDAESGFPRGACATIRRLMLPRDTNARGTIFGGIILSEIDLAAAIEAHKHHSGRLVTIAMDKVVFKSPVYVGDEAVRLECSGSLLAEQREDLLVDRVERACRRPSHRRSRLG